MKEILKGELREYIYNPITREVTTQKVYKIYLDDFNRVLIYEPINVKTINRLRKILKYNNIEPTNILIGRDLISNGGID